MRNLHSLKVPPTKYLLPRKKSNFTMEKPDRQPPSSNDRKNITNKGTSQSQTPREDATGHHVCDILAENK